MNTPSPAEMPAVGEDFRRSRDAVDRGAVIVALVVSTVVGVIAAQSFDGLAIGLIIGSTFFALLAPLLATAAR
jgi:hypothetical protein